MKWRSIASILFATTTATGATIAGCGGSNNPSTTTNTGTAAASSTANTGSSTSSAGLGGGGASSSGMPGSAASSSAPSSSASTGTSTASVDGGSDGAEAGAAAACPSGLQDKVTTCTPGTSPDCTKGCGPDLPVDAGQPNLGTKTCTCSTAGVYECSDCAYISPLPGCYVVSASASACAATVTNEAACTTACSGNGTGNDVCLMTTDAGKMDGCLCVEKATGPEWTCATLPW